MAPPQTGEVVAHTGRGKAHCLIFLRAQSAVTFRQFLAIRAVDQRDMRPDRYVPAHGVVNHHLARGVVEVIIPADHMGHAHVMVINNNGQHIDGRTIGT